MYQINQTIIKTKKGEDITTYGITYGPIEFKDISIHKEKIEKLIELCNKGNLSPIHLEDVVEDFLTDFQVWHFGTQKTNIQ